MYLKEKKATENKLCLFNPDRHALFQQTIRLQNVYSYNFLKKRSTSSFFSLVSYNDGLDDTCENSPSSIYCEGTLTSMFKTFKDTITSCPKLSSDFNW